MKLIYSPDDYGWYFQRFSDWKVSQLFISKEEAYKARYGKKIKWE